MSASLEQLTSLAKRRGFLYQGSEIYGGLAGTYDYGPLGVQLKRNISNLWWKMFVEDRADMYGLDSAILMNRKVWEASGHTGAGFADPLIECDSCGTRLRVDTFIKDLSDYYKKLDIFFAQREGFVNSYLDGEYSDLRKEELLNKLEEVKLVIGPGTYPAHNTVQELKEFFVVQAHKDARKFLGDFPAWYLNNNNYKCPNCNKLSWYPARTFNMMFETFVGPIQDDDAKAFLRPETAQGMFVNFKNIVDSFYPDMPFGIAQIGRNFRNEISPREFIFRVREFEIMELEYFIEEKDWEKEFDAWVQNFYNWCEAIGLDKNKVHELDVPKEDRAHYSKRTIDFEYEFSFGTKEIAAVAYRTDFDLSNHAKHSGAKLEYRPKEGGEAFVPHVIEPTFGLDRNLLAVLAESYREEDGRTWLALPENIAPVKYAVAPLARNKPELVAKAKEIYEALQKKHGRVEWHSGGNVGKFYARSDEIGTPHCITVDFETLENDTVTIRDRDTTDQKRISISELLQIK